MNNDTKITNAAELESKEKVDKFKKSLNILKN